jgi:hypothetical protein
MPTRHSAGEWPGAILGNADRGTGVARPRRVSPAALSIVTTTFSEQQELVELVYAIIKAQAYGWGSARTIGLMAAEPF